MKKRNQDSYTDSRCQMIESMLRTTPEFADCVVKRFKHINSSIKDPFSIERVDGTGLALLYEWELDMLTEPDLLYAYLNAQRVKAEHVHVYEVGLLVGYVLFFIGLIPLCYMTVSLFFGRLSILMVNLVAPILILILAIGGVILSISWIRHGAIERRLDIESAKEDPMFLEALRILASYPDEEIQNRFRYKKRLKAIETSAVM